MTKLSDTQQRILVAASTQPQTDVREHMQDLKSPAIRNKVIESMLKHGLIIEAPDSEEVVYIISAAGLAAIGSHGPILAERSPTLGCSSPRACNWSGLGAT